MFFSKSNTQFGKLKAFVQWKRLPLFGSQLSHTLYRGISSAHDIVYGIFKACSGFTRRPSCSFCSHQTSSMLVLILCSYPEGFTTRIRFPYCFCLYTTSPCLPSRSVITFLFLLNCVTECLLMVMLSVVSVIRKMYADVEIHFCSTLVSGLSINKF